MNFDKKIIALIDNGLCTEENGPDSFRNNLLKELIKRYIAMNRRIYGAYITIFLCFIAFLTVTLTKREDEQFKPQSDKSRYYVIDYDSDWKIKQKLFCSEVRKNDEKKEVVCTLARTGDIYILTYPVSIKDITYTDDYLKYIKIK